MAVVTVEPVTAAGVVPPIIVPSIAPPFTSTESDFIVVNVAAADALAPIIAPSTAPPLMSAESVVIVENVAAADVPAPIVVPSIAPPSISTVPEDIVLIVIALIVPPSILSPEIWSFARTRVPADKSAVSDAPSVTPPVRTPSLIDAPSIVIPLPTVFSAKVSAFTVPVKVASEPVTALSNVMPAPFDSSAMLSTEIESIACEPIFRSASAVPTLNSQTSSVSFHCRVALSAVPLSISIPAVPAVTPAAVSPLFRTIELSVISVLVVLIDVRVPLTVKSPVTVTSPPNEASPLASSVSAVDVALSSIPVDAKSEIVPPSILSPEIASLSNVSV